MRASRSIGIVCAALAVALAGAAAPAGSAAAAKPKPNLIIKSAGAEAPVSSTAEELLVISRGAELCFGEGVGELETNGRPVDQLSFPSFWNRSGCQHNVNVEYHLSRLTATVVTVASNDTAQVKFEPKLAVTIPGPCTYEYGRLKFSFSSGYTESPSITVAAKLHKKGSNPGCAAEESLTFREILSDPKTGSPYELETTP